MTKKVIGANLISGMSLIFLIVLGINYLIFKNTNPYENLTIEIINNPIFATNNIDFKLTGKKILTCSVNNVFGTATNGTDTVYLHDFVVPYTRNSSVGNNVVNRWTMAMPEELYFGKWKVTMTGDWSCKYWIFEETTTRAYDNILLIVK